MIHSEWFKRNIFEKSIMAFCRKGICYRVALFREERENLLSRVMNRVSKSFNH